MESPETGMIVRDRAGMMPVQAVADVEKIGNWFARSGMFGCKTVEQGQVLALSCHMEGMTPLEFNRRHHIIDGQVSMRADAMLAEFRAKHGGKHRVLSRTPDKAEIELTPEGEKAVKFALTWEEAKAEPFVWGKTDKSGKRQLKTNYATPRARSQMLWARVVSDAIRVVCPEVCSGVYTPEELRDMSPEVQPPPVRDLKPGDVQISDPAQPPTADAQPLASEEPPAKSSKSEKSKTSAPAKKPEAPPQEPKPSAPPEPEAADDSDPTVMPVGPKKGKKWEEFSLAALNMIVEQGKSRGLTDKHLAGATKARDAATAAAEKEKPADND